MGLVLDLPSDVCIDVLSAWLPLRDLVGLDTALCNYSQRANFLTSIESNLFVLKKEHHGDFASLTTIAWICKRKVGVSSLHLPRLFPLKMRDALMEYLTSRGGIIQHLNWA